MTWDRQDFLKTLAEAGQKAGWQVHAYGLMRNHYHVVMETPNANLVAGMAWLQSTYTIRLNHRHRLFGHAFHDRDNPGDLLARQHHRHIDLPLGPHGINHLIQRLVQHFTVKEYQRIHGLVLGRGCDLPPHGQVGEEGIDLPFPVRQVLLAAHARKTDVALNPIEIRPLGVDRVVVEPQDLAHLIE